MPAVAVLPTCSLAVTDPGPRQCNQCGKELTGRQQRWCGQSCATFYGTNHWWTSARFEAIRRARGLTARARCDECGCETDAPEVNHVDPRNGGPYDGGCWNHQPNLQVLCHGCHVAETTRQRRERPIWDAFESGAITADEAQQALDRAYWWKRGLPNPDVAPMDSLWGAA